MLQQCENIFKENNCRFVLLNYGKIYELKIIHVQKRLKKNFRNNFDERYK